MISDEISFHATPHDVFELLVDDRKHAEFSGAEVDLSREIGGDCNWYGSMRGKILEYDQDKKLVHTWRGNDWPDNHYAKVSMYFSPSSAGTILKFTIEDIPNVEPFRSIPWKKGWETAYWNPMKKWLEENAQ